MFLVSLFQVSLRALAALLIGFLSAAIALLVELFFVTSGIVGQGPIGELLRASFGALMFLALIEEVVKFFVVRSFVLTSSALLVLLSGIGFSLFEPFLSLCFPLIQTPFIPHFFVPVILLHTASFVLYSIPTHRLLTLLAFAIGSTIHIVYNTAISHNSTVFATNLTIVYGAVAFFFLLAHSYSMSYTTNEK